MSRNPSIIKTRALSGKVAWFASKKKQMSLTDTLVTQKNKRGIRFLDPSWLSKNTVGTANIVSFFLLFYIICVLHPYFRWSWWMPMRWKPSSFPSSFLHGRWRLTTVIPIFASLYHLFCGYENSQKQPCVCVLEKKCFSKCCKICRRTRVPESIFDKVKLATSLKKDSGTCVLVWVFLNY